MSFWDTVKNVATAEAKVLTNPLGAAKDAFSAIKKNSDSQSNWFMKAFAWTPLGAATNLTLNAAKTGDIDGTKSR